MGRTSYYALHHWASQQLDAGFFVYNGPDDGKRKALQRLIRDSAAEIFPPTSFSIPHIMSIVSPTLRDFGIEFAPQFASQTHYNPFATPPPTPIYHEPKKDFNRRLLVHLMHGDTITFPGSDIAIPRQVILHPDVPNCIMKDDELVVVLQDRSTHVVKAIRNHGSPTRQPFCNVLECTDL
jgi:hypothetical protein